MSKIRRDLPNNEYQAAVGANNASAANVFATMADIVAGTGDANRIVFNVKINQVGGINKGQAVYVNGADGTNILVGKADYSTEATSSKTLGLLITSGANNDQRQVVAEGILKGTGSEPLNTSAATAGDPVWLGDDGNLIYGLTNKPSAPDHLVFIGIVVEANPTVGEIFVKVQNGFELQELHNVSIPNPNNNDVLTYDALTGLWVSKPVSSSSGATELLTGGTTWSGTGMVFNVSALTYTVDGVVISTAPTSVTLAAGDPSLPRFDAIVADRNGVVYVIPGTPATNPTIPVIPTDVVLIQYVLVAAGATTPTITNEYVYRDNVFPDWTAASVAGAAPSLIANFASTFPVPFEGSQCTLIQAPTYNAGKYFQFTKPSGSIVRANFSFLTFRVYLPAAITSRNILVRLYNGATVFATGVYATSWGLNMGTTGSWQLVVIPLSSFGSVSIANITRVLFYVTGNAANTFSAGYDRVAFDDVKFQSGYGPQTSVAKITVQEAGNIIGDTATLNFTGTGLALVTASVDTLNNRINVNTQVDAYQRILDEGIILPARTFLNFAGDGVTVTDDIINARTLITIPGNQGNTTYYLNDSVSQAPYQEFSSIKTTGAQVSNPYSVFTGTTAIVGEYLTPSGIPGTTNLVGGLWSFYLHFAGTAGQSWTFFVEVYKRSSGGVETLILTTDSVTATGLSATPQMFYVDGVLSSQAVLTTDRILIRVKATNNTLTNNTVTFVTEGNTYYSIANTTLNQSVPAGAVISVSATAPVTSSGGTTPTIAIPVATGLADGYLSSTDWTTFNNKLSQAYQTVEDEGVALTQRSNINFVGAGVNVTDVGGKTVVTINGGASAGTAGNDIFLSNNFI